MNIAILTSIHNTLENVEVHGKENMTRLVACVNAIEQLIQEESKPVQEQPAEQPRAEEVPAETPGEESEGVVADGK